MSVDVALPNPPSVRSLADSTTRSHATPMDPGRETRRQLNTDHCAATDQFRLPLILMAGFASPDAAMWEIGSSPHRRNVATRVGHGLALRR
jgi:hypothetical protein